jgi:hypothetical protein
MHFLLPNRNTLKMFTLLFTLTLENLIVSGKTFPIKTQLKALGGRWDGGRWVLPLSADSPLTRARLIENCRLGLIAEKAEKAEKAAEQLKRHAYFHSPEFVKNALAAKAAGSPHYYWICCEHCRVIDVSRQTVWCNACGADYGGHIEGFFVRGRLRTGD